MDANSMRVHLRHWRVLRLDSCFCFAGSGRAGGGRCWRRQPSGRGDGPASSSVRQHPVEDVLEQAVKAAAMPDDGDAQFLPQRMGRDDAEIATDVGDDRTDRPAADHRVKPGGMLRQRSAPAWGEGQDEGRPPWWAWRRLAWARAVLVALAPGRVWVVRPGGPPAPRPWLRARWRA